MAHGILALILYGSWDILAGKREGAHMHRRRQPHACVLPLRCKPRGFYVRKRGKLLPKRYGPFEGSDLARPSRCVLSLSAVHDRRILRGSTAWPMSRAVRAGAFELEPTALQVLWRRRLLRLRSPAVSLGAAGFLGSTHRPVRLRRRLLCLLHAPRRA